MNTINKRFFLVQISNACAVILAAACGSSNEKGSDTGRDTSVCVDSEYVNTEACAALCESKDSRADCEAVYLSKPETEYYMFFGHGCRWYDAVEVNMSDAGGCTFGEKRSICGYAAWGDIQCGGNGLWCDGWENFDYEVGAGYYYQDGKTFLFRDLCAPQQAGSLHQCRWESLVYNEVTLTKSIEECACACDMDAGVGI